MFCNLGHDSAEGFLLSGADCRIQVIKMKTKEDMVQKQQRNLRCLFFHSLRGGFLDMGFEKAGFRICWTNEMNPVFASIYSYGMTLWKQSEKPERKW